MRYKYPIAYAMTKVLANHIHRAILPVRMPKVRYPTTLATPISVRETVEVASRTTPVVEEYKEYGEPIVSRPTWKPIHAAVKRNGGLRGSTATKWR